MNICATSLSALHRSAFHVPLRLSKCSVVLEVQRINRHPPAQNLASRSFSFTPRAMPDSLNLDAVKDALPAPAKYRSTARKGNAVRISLPDPFPSLRVPQRLRAPSAVLRGLGAGGARPRL